MGARRTTGGPADRVAAERGSGTVLAVGLVGVLATLLVAGLLVAAVAMTGQRARTAADLAALAVAGRVVEGETHDVACGAGAQVAARHGAAVVSCRVLTSVAGSPRAEVEVSKDVQGTPWVARARAAAGGVPARSGRRRPGVCPRAPAGGGRGCARALRPEAAGAGKPYMPASRLL